MKTLRHYWVALLLVGVALIVAGGWYGRLPDPVPTHWGLDGQANGWTAKPLGVFLEPLLGLALTALFIVLPQLSPRGFEMTPFQRLYPTIVAAVAGLLLYVTIFALAAASGAVPPAPAYLMAGIGVFLAVIGNLFGKVTRNFFIGIRTPWTLASDQVWERTHRFAAPVFVLGGVLLAVASLSATPPIALVAILVVTILVPVPYSYIVWRRGEAHISGNQ